MSHESAVVTHLHAWCMITTCCLPAGRCRESRVRGVQHTCSHRHGPKHPGRVPGRVSADAAAGAVVWCKRRSLGRRVSGLAQSALSLWRLLFDPARHVNMKTRFLLGAFCCFGTQKGSDPPRNVQASSKPQDLLDEHCWQRNE